MKQFSISLGCLIFLFIAIDAGAQTTNVWMTPAPYTLVCGNGNIQYYDPQPSSSVLSGTTTCNYGLNNGNYLNTANMTQTICTDNGSCLSLTITYITICGDSNGLNNPLGAGGADTLWIYDGASTASPLLQWYDGYSTGHLNVTSGTFAATSSCVTFKFRSGTYGSRRGWSINATCGSCPSSPVNNECSGAITLTPGSSCVTTSGTTQFSTASAGIPAACTGTNANDDVWYQFTANNSTQTITMAPVNTSMNPVIQVFSGTCASLTQVACGNSTGVNQTETLNLTGLSSGATYYVRVYDASANSPFSNNYNYTICVVGSAPNDCLGATQVCSSGQINTSNSGIGGQEFGQPTFGCLVSGEHNTAWYYFKATSNGTLEFTISRTCGTYQDIDMALWGPFTTGLTCGSSLGSPARCTYAVPNSSSTLGLTCTENSTDVSEGAGGSGNQLAFVYCMPLIANDYYVLLVDVFSGCPSYSITWTLSGGGAIGGCVLPVELSSFTGLTIDKHVNELDWITSSEFNTHHFEIERSADGVHFATIANLNASGNSTTQQNYQYLDKSAPANKNYYRLKQIDNDGLYTYSYVVLLENGEKSAYIRNIYPNPSTGATNFDLYSPEAGSAVFEVYDVLGTRVVSKEINVLAGVNSITEDLSPFKNGLYEVRIALSKDQQLLTGRVIKD